MEYPLSNYRVVDFGWVAAGAATGKILADLGAEVIKVETRRRPDTTRFTPDNIKRSPETDPAFHSLNRNKLGITVGMTHPEGSKLLKKLIKVSDIVLENFFPGVMKRYGLDYESLCLEKPDLIMLSLPGLGSWGPLAETPAYAHTLAALSGLESMVGYCGERILGIQQNFSDNNAAIHGAFAILAAVVHHRRTGEGQYIEVAQLEAMTTCVGEAVVEHQLTGRTPGTQGNRHAGMVIHNNYPCQGKDKWVSIAVKTETEWQRLGEAMGNPPELQAEGFKSREGRLRHREELDRIIASWTSEHTPYEVTEMLQRRGVAASPVMDIEDCYLDTHIQEREVFTICPHPAMGEEAIPNLSWKMSSGGGKIRRPAPMLGEHNQYVLGHVLGLSEAEIAALEAQGVLS